MTVMNWTKWQKKRCNIISGEYNDMIENMETDIARNFEDNVIINDLYM